MTTNRARLLSKRSLFKTGAAAHDFQFNSNGQEMIGWFKQSD
jgi:hypothetical protein